MELTELTLWIVIFVLALIAYIIGFKMGVYFMTKSALKMLNSRHLKDEKVNEIK